MKLKEENKYLSESNIELNNTINLLQKENILINQKYLEIKSSIEKLKIENSGLKDNLLIPSQEEFIKE